MLLAENTKDDNIQWLLETHNLIFNQFYMLLAENIKDDNILICFILYTYIKHQALSTREIDNNTYLTASSSCKSVSRSEAVVLFKSVSRSETVLSHK